MGCGASKPDLDCHEPLSMSPNPISRKKEMKMNINNDNPLLQKELQEKRGLGSESDSLMKGMVGKQKLASSDAREEEEEKELGNEREEGDLGDEIMPGSPSFRVYNTNSISDSESIYELMKKEERTSIEKCVKRTESSALAIRTKGLEYRSSKKEKQRRLRAFAGRPAAVYSRLNVALSS